MDGVPAFYCSFAPFLILPFSLAHPSFDMDAYGAELNRETSCRLRMVRTGLSSSICDTIIDEIAAILDIA